MPEKRRSRSKKCLMTLWNRVRWMFRMDSAVYCTCDRRSCMPESVKAR